MRKYLLIPLLLLSLTACEKQSEEPKRKSLTLTFEGGSFTGGDAENDNTITTDWWSQYIDSPQYGGNLL